MINKDDMTDNEKEFLLSLIEDGSKTDTEIADETGMSKSTANRIRRKFEENGVLAEYIPIVRLESVGIELFATLTLECDGELDEKEIARIPNVIFMGETDSFQESYVIFAGFGGFEEYNQFIEDFKAKYQDKVTSFEKNLIAPHNIIKEDFTHVIKHNIKESLDGGNDA